MANVQDQFATYEKIVEGRHHQEEIVVETKHGDLDFRITPLPRTDRWEYISKLPSGLFEEADLDDDGNPIGDIEGSMVPDGEGAEAFENMVIESLRHDMLQEPEIRELVQEGFSDELVFELGAKILELSTDTGGVKSFRPK